MSGINRLDEAKLRLAVGGEDVKRSNAEQVRNYTSFVIGRTPISLNDAMPVIVDEDLTELPVVYAAAGTSNHNFAIAPSGLVKLARARVADLKID